MTNTKQIILQESNGGLDFFFFVLGELEMIDDNRCKNTLNPFYDDGNPSFSVYLIEDDDRWRFKDYGDESYSGDVFDFAATYYDLDVKKDFAKVLSKMAEDLRVKTIKPKVSVSKDKIVYPEDYVIPGWPQWACWREFSLIYSGPNNGLEDAYKYFKDYGITKEVLKRYNVEAIKGYEIADWENIKIVPKFLHYNTTVISYSDVYFAKLYSPNPKRFWYVGRKEKDFVFGMRQVLRKLRREPVKSLILTGGEKDVLSLASLGYDAISLNSETANIPETLTDDFLNNFDKIILLYDIDETGNRMALKMSNALQARGVTATVVTLPSELTSAGGKDVSDYIKLNFPIGDLHKLLSVDEGADVEQVREESKQDVKNETLELGMKKMPVLPETVYNSLPDLLKDLCGLFNDPIEKDVLLMSSLTVLSSFMPMVKGVYSGKKIGTNFYLFISAPSASFKGAMSWSRTLGRQIQLSLKEQFDNAMVVYKQRLAYYNENKKENPHLVEPEKPKLKVMFIPANTSTSKIIEHLEANDNFGIIYANEGDTLTNATKNEWGDFSPIIRNAFHHEPVELSRRTNNEFLTCEHPHLSLVLSGTFNQVNNLIRSVEDGYFSRFLFYEFDPSLQWIDQFGDGDNAVERSFEAAAEVLNTFWKENIHSCNTIIRFEKEHIKIINEIFSGRLKSMSYEHGGDIGASVKRYCIIAYRIAMVLTVLKQIETSLKLPEQIMIAEEEFLTAMEIVDVLFVHLERVYTRMTNQKVSEKLNRQQEALYKALPPEFTTQEFESIRASLEVNFHTGKKYLDDFQELEVLEKVKHAHYRKLNR